MEKKNIIIIKGYKITVLERGIDDYISLTDMVKGYGDDTMIYSWMRNRNTLEFIGIWEEMNNPDFKENRINKKHYPSFEKFKCCFPPVCFQTLH